MGLPGYESQEAQLSSESDLPNTTIVSVRCGTASSEPRVTAMDQDEEKTWRGSSLPS